MSGPIARHVLLALVAMSAIGCSYITPSVDPDDRGESVGGPPVAAEQIVATWLDRASQGTGDLGWSLLYPNLRTDLFETETRYREAIEGQDWSGVTWEVLDADLHDGEYQVGVRFDGPLPAVLADWGLAQQRDDGTAVVVVRLGVGAEGSGIQAVGGPPPES